MFTQDSNKLKLEQQLTALRQELEATKSERDEALSSLAALQKGSKAAISTVVVMQNSAKDEQVVKSPQSTLQDSDDKQTSSREGDIKSVISQGNLKDNQTSLKWQRRRLIKQILGRKVTKSMVQEAIKLYDLEKDYTSQSPEALSGLERLFGIDDIEWPSEYDRMIMISEKVSHSLKNTLRMYGYDVFAFYAEDHKGRLEISPPCPGQDPPKLPQWLQIPYLVPVKGISGKLNFERCANPCIQRGDKLFDKDSDKTVGTLGTVMVTQHSKFLTYVCLTAGHVIPDGDKHMLVRNPIDQSMMDLKVARLSVRYQERPLGRAKIPSNFQDDCAFLVIDQKDLSYFDHSIPCIDLNFYASSKSGLVNALDPLATRRRKNIEFLLSRSRLVVYKKGAETDLTMGYLVRVYDKAPPGWYGSQLGQDNIQEWLEQNGDGDAAEKSSIPVTIALASVPVSTPASNSVTTRYQMTGSSTYASLEDYGDRKDDIDKDENEWLGLVQWADVPFSAPGDSGSLVFALEEGVTIPLGIHVGAPASVPQHSIFISIETFCFEAEKEGWDLQFTERPSEAVRLSTGRISQSVPSPVTPSVPPPVLSPVPLAVPSLVPSPASLEDGATICKGIVE